MMMQRSTKPQAPAAQRRGTGARVPHLLGAATALLLLGVAALGFASEERKPVARTYVAAPHAPEKQTAEDARRKSVGCVSCHTPTDNVTMHANPAVVLGCTDCHGGDATAMKPPGSKANDPAYVAARDAGHVLPRYPEDWHFPSSANPKQSYTLLNREAPEFIRFFNPGDYRVARESCGACHLATIQAAERSLMSTSAMLWGGAAYNNGILPFKRYLLGEVYTDKGEPASVVAPVKPTPFMKEKGILAQLYPLPAWETIPPADIFRVFERGGRVISSQFPEIGMPEQHRRAAEARRARPARHPAVEPRAGHGLAHRRARDQHPQDAAQRSAHVVPRHQRAARRLPVVGVHRLPRGLRQRPQSAARRAVLALRPRRHDADRRPDDPEGPERPPAEARLHAGDPVLAVHGLPHAPAEHLRELVLRHTMWDYESDAPFMWPEKQKYPTSDEIREINLRNPEEAAIRGKWGDPEFLRNVSSLNPQLKDTQFADYHGHGWNFRAIFKRDRKGTLLDKDGKPVADSDPEKFIAKDGGKGKAVQLASIHMELGLHCVDCHFGQDAHGNGHIYGEVAAAIEIDCADCHGTATRYPNLFTTGPAARPGGADLSLLRTQDGRKRFEWRAGKLYQRAALDPTKEWEMTLVKDTVNPDHPKYNPKAARAKLMSAGTSMEWGPGVDPSKYAHGDDKMTCFTCHLSWTTSCAGCHLPIQANWKTERQHYEGGETRNFATYNPQVARDEMFQLGKHGPVKGGKIAPVRSSSALILSSTNINREKIYIQQPPIAASGFSSQAFAPHYPHTERKTETKTCTDCHISQQNDNNAIMAQLLLHGTNFVNFVGYNAWVGEEGRVTAVQVTEWDEPQAVIGSYLHRYAYPDWFADHQKRDQRLPVVAPHDTRGPRRMHPDARRVHVRRRGTGRLPRLRHRERGQQGLFAEGGERARSRRSATTPRCLRPTRPAWRCRPTSRSRRGATRAT